MLTAFTCSGRAGYAQSGTAALAAPPIPSKGRDMIKHIVMWTLKDEAEGKSKAENLNTMKALLEELPSKVPGVVELEVATSGLFESVPPTDIALYTVFKSKEDLKAYAVHPEHQSVVAFVKSVAAERRVIDYEV
jgi:hypothetical protein